MERWLPRKLPSKIVDAGVRRVSISLDGADAATHDAFRGIPGAFDKALRGLRNLKDLGMSVQINMTIARHNAHQLPDVLEMARQLGRGRPPHLPAGSGGLRRGHCRRADGPRRRIRKNFELVLRPRAGRRHRVEGHLRASLLPRRAPTPRGGAPRRLAGGVLLTAAMGTKSAPRK